MISFFLAHIPSFLTMGITALGAILLKAAAQTYAEKDEP